MQQALQSDFIQQQIRATRASSEQKFATGKKSIIGANEYPNIEEAISEQTVKQVEQQSDDPSMQPPSITALIGALAEGESINNYQTTSTQTSKPITAYRNSEVYERLRLRSNAYLASHGSLPTASLLTLGTAKDYSARVAFCKGFLAIAGIDAASSDIEDSPSSALVILCSSDELYLKNELAVDEIVKNIPGNATVWIAGNNPNVMQLFGSTVSESVHLRCDRPALLDTAMTLLGAPQT